MAKHSNIGKIRGILGREGITPTILYGSITEECIKLGMKPTITKSEISHFLFDDRPDRQVSSYLKILLGLNALHSKKMHPRPYVLEEIIDDKDTFTDDNQKCKLYYILEKEAITPAALYASITKECANIGVKATVTESDISNFSFNDKPGSQISCHLEVLLGLNALCNKKYHSNPYTLEEIIDKDNIIEAVKRSKRNI